MQKLDLLKIDIAFTLDILRKADANFLFRKALALKLESLPTKEDPELNTDVLESTLAEYGYSLDHRKGEIPCITPDELLSCLIYILVKANAIEMPALLSIAGHFTLESRSELFDYMQTTLNAALLFIRYEMNRLGEPTLHYTYLDGKSYLGEKINLERARGDTIDSDGLQTFSRELGSAMREENHTRSILLDQLTNKLEARSSWVKQRSCKIPENSSHARLLHGLPATTDVSAAFDYKDSFNEPRNSLIHSDHK